MTTLWPAIDPGIASSQGPTCWPPKQSFCLLVFNAAAAFQAIFQPSEIPLVCPTAQTPCPLHGRPFETNPNRRGHVTTGDVVFPVPYPPLTTVFRPANGRTLSTTTPTPETFPITSSVELYMRRPLAPCPWPFLAMGMMTPIMFVCPISPVHVHPCHDRVCLTVVMSTN